MLTSCSRSDAALRQLVRRLNTRTSRGLAAIPRDRASASVLAAEALVAELYTAILCAEFSVDDDLRHAIVKGRRANVLRGMQQARAAVVGCQAGTLESRDRANVQRLTNGPGIRARDGFAEPSAPGDGLTEGKTRTGDRAILQAIVHACPRVFIGHLLDTPTAKIRKCLILLALPRGLEPLFSP